MRARFPADCRPVSDRFRNTLFICLAPSAAPLTLRAHSRAGARLLRCASRSLAGWRPGCSASLRAHSRAGARLLRFASRSLAGWRPAAPLRFALTRGLAPGLFPLGCCAGLGARAWGCRPAAALTLRAPVSSRSTASLRARAWGCRPAAALTLRAPVSSRSTAALGSARAPGAGARLRLRLRRCCRGARACQISQARGLCYAGGRSGARFSLPAPSISDLSGKELASA